MSQPPIKQVYIDEHLEGVSNHLTANSVLSNINYVFSNSGRDSFSFQGLELRRQNVGDSKVTTVNYNGQPVFSSSNTHPSSGTPYVHISGNYVTQYNRGRWLDILKNARTKIGASDIEFYKEHFKLTFYPESSKLDVSNRLEEIKRQIIESDLINKCIQFANLDPSPKREELSDHINVKSTFTFRDVTASYDCSRSLHELKVRYHQRPVFFASTHKFSDNPSIDINGTSVFTYIPGKWEGIISESIQDASPETVRQLEGNFGFKA